MKKPLHLLFITITFLFSGMAAALAPQQSSSSADASVYIITPEDGAIVSSPVLIRFGLKGMGVAPAGTDRENTGHHHLLVDGEALPNMKQAMGPNVQHFGGGQTEAFIELLPGEHTLQLIMGDKFHVPHSPPVVSEKITIIVE
jgi:hypothetical protein